MYARCVNYLISGGLGSGGSYLSEYILAERKDALVFAPVRWHSSSSHKKNPLLSHPRFRVIECDLTDTSSVFRLFEESQPKVVFNLAAHANVRASFDNPVSVFENNTKSTHNLLEASRRFGGVEKWIMCSTSEVYGNPNEESLPITESSPLDPVSPYAASKVAQEMLAISYLHSFEIPVVITRMFTYINPRRSDLFATAFALRLLGAKEKGESFISVGNLESIRTILDVRDAVSAYLLVADEGDVGDTFNICGNTLISVKEFLELLCSELDFHPQIHIDEKLIRPSDVTRQIGDSSLFRSKIGWKEMYSLNDSIGFLLDELRH